MADQERATGDLTCPECDESVIPGSDKCRYCGAPLDSGEGVSLEVWEWGGGLVACIGFFMTPIVTALPAIYCASRVYDQKPVSAYVIVSVVVTTVMFWVLVLALTL